MVQRVRRKLKTSSKSITPTEAHFALLSQPQLLEGEDAAAYDELLGRLCAAVKPVDIIDEMLTADMAHLQWEVLRWRRLKVTLMRALQLEALSPFLSERCTYNRRSEEFVDYLSEVLQYLLEGEPANDARMLASDYVDEKPDAVNKVHNLFADNLMSMDQVMTAAREHARKQLVQDYERHDPDAVTVIEENLAHTGLSLDALLANELYKKPRYLDYIERLDRLASIAESRRNAGLREIERRRAVLGQALRRSVQQIEDAEFEVIDTMPAKERMRRDKPAQD